MALSIKDLKHKLTEAKDDLPQAKDEYFLRCKILNKKWSDWIELNSWTSEEKCKSLASERFKTLKDGSYIVTGDWHRNIRVQNFGNAGLGLPAKYQIVYRTTRYGFREYPAKPGKPWTTADIINADPGRNSRQGPANGW